MPFTIETDASDKTIGSVLKQNGKKIMFYSYKFTLTEARYASMDKEALRILKSMKFYEPYIISRKVYIFTDNQNLLYYTDLSKRVQRWKLLLEEYNYELKRIEGKTISWRTQFQDCPLFNQIRDFHFGTPKILN